MSQWVKHRCILRPRQESSLDWRISLSPRKTTWKTCRNILRIWRSDKKVTRCHYWWHCLTWTRMLSERYRSANITIISSGEYWETLRGFSYRQPVSTNCMWQEVMQCCTTQNYMTSLVMRYLICMMPWKSLKPTQDTRLGLNLICISNMTRKAL